MKADKKTILAIVLGIAALGVVMYQVSKVLPTAPKPVAGAASTASAVVSSPQNITASGQEEPASSPLLTDNYEFHIAMVEEEDLAYRSINFRNPMAPLVSGGRSVTGQDIVSSQEFSLEPTDALSMGYTIGGIVWNEVEPLALINDQVVGVGEKLNDGSLVSEITSDTVRFTKDGKNYYLVFREE